MRKLTTSELKRLSKEEFKSSSRMPVVLVLDNVRSAYNVGSVFRTADAFAVDKILLCGITATPPQREVVKTAIGSENSVEWRYFEKIVDAIQYLKKELFEIVLIEQTDQSVNLEQFVPQGEKRYAFVFGNEVSGVSHDLLSLADSALEIPQFGTKHSFNISVSAGIVLWNFYLLRQRIS